MRRKECSDQLKTLDEEENKGKKDREKNEVWMGRREMSNRKGGGSLYAFQLDQKQSSLRVSQHFAFIERRVSAGYTTKSDI